MTWLHPGHAAAERSFPSSTKFREITGHSPRWQGVLFRVPTQTDSSRRKPYFGLEGWKTKTTRDSRRHSHSLHLLASLLRSSSFLILLFTVFLPTLQHLQMSRFPRKASLCPGSQAGREFLFCRAQMLLAPKIPFRLQAPRHIVNFRGVLRTLSNFFFLTSPAFLGAIVREPRLEPGSLRIESVGH